MTPIAFLHPLRRASNGPGVEPEPSANCRRIFAASRRTIRGWAQGSAPGYGFRPEEHSAALEQFVTALGLGEIRLMVHDWGGPDRLGFGRPPELIHSLMIGNTWAWPAHGSRAAAFSHFAGNPLSRLLIRRFNAVE